MAISQAQSVSSSSGFNRSQQTQQSRSRSGYELTPQQQEELTDQFGYLRQQLAGVNPQQDFAQRLASVGGTPTPFSTPPISQAFSPTQMEMGINQRISSAPILTQGQQRGDAGLRAGRGVVSTGPGAADLNRAIQAGNYRTAVADATQFELGASERNAALEIQSWLARLQSESLAANRDVQGRQLALADKGLDVTDRNALMQALNPLLARTPFASTDSSGQSTSFGRDQSISSYRAS